MTIEQVYDGPDPYTRSPYSARRSQHVEAALRDARFNYWRCTTECTYKLGDEFLGVDTLTWQAGTCDNCVGNGVWCRRRKKSEPVTVAEIQAQMAEEERERARKLSAPISDAELAHVRRMNRLVEEDQEERRRERER